ncbi:hypothetical protein [Georgfuchsia toluolica]|nr:hypothetical protein [Georgfuchsia toluolica]
MECSESAGRLQLSKIMSTGTQATAESTALKERAKRLESNWQSMIRITHDFFHAWRKAVADTHGEPAAREMELLFWKTLASARASCT